MLPLFTFRTNGVNNPNQSVLDLRAGANVTLQVSMGQVTIASSGGGGGTASVAKVGASGTLGAAPTILRPLFGSGWVTATAQSQVSAKDEIAGAIIIGPGQLVCIESAVGAISVVAAMTWCELPI